MVVKGCLNDGREVKAVRVVFMYKEIAEREKRPLLEAGVKVIYLTAENQKVEITE